MRQKLLNFNTKKFISILCAIAVLVTALPLNAFLMSTAAATGDTINFEGENAASIVEGNDAFSLLGQDKEDKYYLYAKNNTANTLTLNFDNIELDVGEKYTIDFDVYTLRMSKDEDNKLLGLKLYGEETSLNTTIINMDVCEEDWANYHTSFVAKEENNKLDFSLYTFGKLFIDNFVLIDENGKETAIDFAKACEKTEHPDHFSSATLYDIAYDEVDVVDGYLKAVVPENSNTIHNEGVDIPFNIGKKLDEGRYTVTLDLKFTAVGTCRNSFCVSVAGMGAEIQQKWIDAVDITLNKYQTYSYEFDLLPEHDYFRFNVYQGCTAYIDNVILTDAAGIEVVKFDFDEPVNFKGNYYEQKGIPKNKAASAALYSRLMTASNDKDYAIYFDSSIDNNFWITKKGTDVMNLGMEELNLPAGNTYTVDFDVYSLTLGHRVVFGATTEVWTTNPAIEGGHQVWKEAPTSVNTWTHYSFDVTTIAEWKGVMFYVIDDADGFTGYIDNLTIKDSNGTVVASYNPTEADTTLTSNCASIVNLPDSVLGKDPDAANTMMYVDTTSLADDGEANKSFWFNELGMPSYYNKLVSGETYTVVFDVYPEKMPTSNNLFTFDTANGQPEGSTRAGYWGSDLQEGKWQTTSNIFTIADATKSGNHVLYVYGGFKGYIDNFKIVDKNGNTVDGTATDFTGFTVPEMYDDYLTIAEFSVGGGESDDGNMKLYVDTTSLADDGEANKSFWFNELGMPSYYNKLVSGETYTVVFDVYPEKMPNSNSLFTFETSNGQSNGSVRAGYWGSDLQEGKWQTTSSSFTIDDATTKGGNHILYVYGGFKGYIDNFRLVDKNGNTVDGTATDFTGLNVPEKYDDYLELTDVAVTDKTPSDGPSLSGMNITVLRGRAGKDGASIKLGGANSPLTIKSNTTYRLSFRYYQANPTNTGVLNLFGINAGFDNDITYFKKNNTEGWANGTVYFTTGEVSNAAADWLEIILNPNAWVYFDNFKIVEQEADNNKEVSVITFDKADDTIYPTSNVEKATFAHSKEHGGTFKAVNATEYTNTDKNSNRGYSFKGIKMKSHTTYRVSIDYYVASPITDYAAAFGYDQTALGSGSGNSWPCFINTTSTLGWQTASFIVTTGDVVPNGEYIKLAFYDVAKTTSPRVMHFDNLTFTELYKVETSVNDATLGAVTKTATVEGGKSTKVVAHAYDGVKFEGWYEYGDLVSTDKTYSIKKIDDNHKLEARFSGEVKPGKKIVQSFEDYNVGEVGFEYYEIVNDSKNALDGKQSLHLKPDKIGNYQETSIFFPVVTSAEHQMKDDYVYDVYVWIKPKNPAESVAYYAFLTSDHYAQSDMIPSGGGYSSIGVSNNIMPQKASALESKNGWYKYLIGTVSKEHATRAGFCFQICKFHDKRQEGASIDDLYIDCVEVVERTPDFENLKFTEVFYNEITNSNFESKITEDNWAPLTDGVSIEKVTDKEYDWQGKYMLKFDAEKSNGQEYVRVIPIAKLKKNYTFAAWTKLSEGSDISVGFYKNGRYQKFENIVNGENGKLKLIDDGRWNRVSFTFNVGDSTEGYLVIKGTKGTLLLDMVELFIAEKGYLTDPNLSTDPPKFVMVDPIAFADKITTEVTYIENEIEETEDVDVEIEETDEKKPNKKKYKVIKKRKAGGGLETWAIIAISVGSFVLLLAAGITIFIVIKKRNKTKKEAV